MVQKKHSRYRCFDRRQLRLQSLNCRHHDLRIDSILSLKPVDNIENGLLKTAESVVRARNNKSAVVFMLGAHVLRDGVQEYLIDLMKRGFISCVALNGAGVIHDFEFSLIGATTESVARYIETGEFGLWEETGKINDLIFDGAENGQGLGEVVGQYIEEKRLPFKDSSILAAGWRFGVPITVHVGIGYDIIHQHPNCDGAALGNVSYTDFLIFTKVLERINRGVVANFGSAVMGPEVFLKGLSMVRNVSVNAGKEVGGFTSLVCDLKSLPSNYQQEAKKSNPYYYFRPWKTMLVRTLADGGGSYYIQGRHRETIPALWTAIDRIDKGIV